MKYLVIFCLLQIFMFCNVTSKAQWVQTSGAIDTNVTQLVVLNSYLFAATTTGYNNGQIIASTDDGASWYSAKTGLLRVIDAFAASGSNLFLSLDDAGVYISTDYGTNWTQTNTTVEPYTFSFLTVGSKLFAGTWYQGVYSTTDNGGSWTQLDSNLTNLFVNVLIVNGSNIFAGTSGGGVYLSTNNGISWASKSSGIPAGFGYIDAMTSISSNIFAGVSDKGVYLSTNNGTNWVAAKTGLPGYLAIIYTIKALVASGNNLFAGTAGGGVYLTTDNGTSWTNVSQGLTHLGINALVIKDGYLFAGADSSVWRRPLSQMITGIQDKQPNLPENFSLQQNYPNPFNPATTINYTLTKAGNAKLTIYNAIGSKVATLVNEYKPAGSYSVNFNGNNLTSGIYLYRLESGNYSAVRKFILMK
jgi:photosystem II stability/assembly factor-like uncharacterized protein